VEISDSLLQDMAKARENSRQTRAKALATTPLTNVHLQAKQVGVATEGTLLEVIAAIVDKEFPALTSTVGPDAIQASMEAFHSMCADRCGPNCTTPSPTGFIKADQVKPEEMSQYADMLGGYRGGPTIKQACQTQEYSPVQSAPDLGGLSAMVKVKTLTRIQELLHLGEVQDALSTLCYVMEQHGMGYSLDPDTFESTIKVSTVTGNLRSLLGDMLSEDALDAITAAATHDHDATTDQVELVREFNVYRESVDTIRDAGVVENNIRAHMQGLNFMQSSIDGIVKSALWIGDEDLPEDESTTPAEEPATQADPPTERIGLPMDYRLSAPDDMVRPASQNEWPR
jgi:hypothetical protein